MRRPVLEPPRARQASEVPRLARGEERVAAGDRFVRAGRQGEGELVCCIRQCQLDVRRQAAWHREDQEADEGAVLAPERQCDDNALLLELETGGGKQRLAGLRLADKPARQHSYVRAVGTALAAYRAAEAVLLPVDQGAPGRAAGTLEHIRHLVERPLTGERSGSPTEQRLAQARHAGTTPDVEQEPEQADRCPDEGDPDLMERSSDEREREAGDRDQLRPVAEVAGARDHRKTVGNGRVAKLGKL